MGKNRRRQLVFKDEVSGLEVECDSQEECDFFAWCEECMRLGVLQSYQYQPPELKLFEPVSFVDMSGKTRVLLRQHSYSADFTLSFCPKKFLPLAKYFKVPFDHMEDESFTAWADVKGTFQRNGGGRSFTLNQKWVLQKHGIYIVKAVPQEMFASCGCPAQCFLTKKTKASRKAFAGMKSIAETMGLSQDTTSSIVQDSNTAVKE